MFDQMDVEGDLYQIKPMNCPFHCLVYKDALRSYRDLPFRWAELGTVYRYERSGTLHGLFRVRGFTQDDAHIFCLPSQLTNEILGVLHLTESILTRFGFESYEIMLSTRPEKRCARVLRHFAATCAMAVRRALWLHTRARAPAIRATSLFACTWLGHAVWGATRFGTRRPTRSSRPSSSRGGRTR
jgi:threonyl-tRNA synthetase